MSSKILLQSRRSFSMLFFFFFFFFFLLVSSLLGKGLALPTNLRAEDCEPKSCGNGLNISYPFWLQDRHPPYCGYPSFKVTCKGSDPDPVLNLVDHEYLIKDIFYEDRTVLVSQASRPDSGCSFPSYNLTLDQTLFRVNSTNRCLFFLFNCSTKLTQYKELRCSDDPTPAYFAGNYSTADGPKFNFSCESVVVPAFPDPATDGDAYTVLLKAGFLLDWNATDCGDCRRSGGHCGYDDDWKSFMCICPDGPQRGYCRKRSNKTKIIIETGIFTASGLSLGCLFLLFYLLRYRKSKSRSKNVQSVEDFLCKYGSIVPKRYKYSEIKKMTNSFGHKIGQGGYGSVFKGNLNDGHPVAVKVLNESKGNGEEFVNEVASIGRTSHVNIVSLLGFCLEGSKRALIYEFMPNGSLEKFIYGEIPNANIKLGWEKLYEIAIGIARGLEYLHRGCNTRMVHFDIKPHNILLDQEFCPKISDFGLAKLCPPKESIISMVGARGTVGYIAPEVFLRNFGVVSSKSDVYSYGMMVFEMVGGRKNIDANAENTSEIYFPHWIYDHLDQYEALEAYGVTNETEEIAKRMILVGLWCIQMSPANRPSMSRVLDMLEGKISDLQIPPKP